MTMLRHLCDKARETEGARQRTHLGSRNVLNV